MSNHRMWRAGATGMLSVAACAGVACANGIPAHAATGTPAVWAAYEATAPAGYASSDHGKFTVDSPTITPAMVGKTVIISITGATGSATPDTSSLHLQWYDGQHWHQGVGVSAPISNGPTVGLKMPITRAMVGQRAQLYGQLSMPNPGMVGTVTLTGKVTIGSSTWSPVGALTASTSGVPFTVTHATDGHRMVFAHWFPPMPRSVDNANPDSDYYTTGYLDPAGENGAHKDEGGFLRDRPLGRAPISGDWQLADAKAEIVQAKASGIDGFAVDVMFTSGTYWDRFQTMLTAADQVGGFSIVIQPDMAVDIDHTNTQNTISAHQLAAALAPVMKANHPALHRVDGKIMLSPFDPDNVGVDDSGKAGAAYFSTVLSDLRGQGVGVYFVPMLLNSGPQIEASFAPISDGISDWGVRDDNSSRTVDQLAAIAHAQGKTWMAPVSPGDYSPAEKVFDEQRGLQTLQNTWDRVRDEDADMVEVATWNDYSESTGIAPTRDHGWALADVDAWYATRFHNGSDPVVTGDEAVITARTQKVADTMNQPAPATLRYADKAMTRPDDEAEALVMLQAPAAVTLTSGNYTLTTTFPAGVNVMRVPLDYGTPTVTVKRNNTTVAATQLPRPVVANAATQDLTYWAATSRPLN